METNKFLMDFMKMRQELRQREAAKPQPKPQAASLRPMPQPSGITLATIIEERPSKAEIIKYLCARRDCLLEEYEEC